MRLELMKGFPLTYKASAIAAMRLQHYYLVPNVGIKPTTSFVPRERFISELKWHYFKAMAVHLEQEHDLQEKPHELHHAQE